MNTLRPKREPAELTLRNMSWQQAVLRLRLRMRRLVMKVIPWDNAQASLSPFSAGVVSQPQTGCSARLAGANGSRRPHDEGLTWGQIE